MESFDLVVEALIAEVQPVEKLRLTEAAARSSVLISMDGLSMETGKLEGGYCCGGSCCLKNPCCCFADDD